MSRMNPIYPGMPPMGIVRLSSMSDEYSGKHILESSGPKVAAGQTS